jgi:hypothetical protein
MSKSKEKKGEKGRILLGLIIQGLEIDFNMKKKAIMGV